MQRKIWIGAVAMVMTLLFVGSASALTIDVTRQKRAKLTTNGTDEIMIKGRLGMQEYFTVSGLATSGTGPASTFETEVFLKIVKFNGKKVRRNFTITGDSEDFRFNNKRKVRMTFVPITVPEPGTLALMGLGLGGLALAGRRRA